MSLLFRLWLCGCLVSCTTLAHGQTLRQNPTRWSEKNTRFYAGVEGVIFINRETQLSSSTHTLSAADKYVEPRPVLFAGYTATPRINIEAGFQMLPVATGVAYQGATYGQSFSQTYNKDYLYVPLRGVVQVLGREHRLGISLLAGGGPAWTNLEGAPGSLFGGSFTAVTTSTDGAGNSTTTTAIQRVAREKTSFAVFEAGLRSSWLVLPHLHLDLTVRQLWTTAGSARDISLDITSGSDHITTTMTTPVRGVATGLGVRYSF